VTEAWLLAPLPVKSMISTGRLPWLLADSIVGSEGVGRGRFESGGKLDWDQEAAGLESTRCRRLGGGVLAEGEGAGAGPDDAGAGFEVEDGCMDLERSCN
jgi:hypothetical protein